MFKGATIQPSSGAMFSNIEGVLNYTGDGNPQATPLVILQPATLTTGLAGGAIMLFVDQSLHAQGAGGEVEFIDIWLEGSFQVGNPGDRAQATALVALPWDGGPYTNCDVVSERDPRNREANLLKQRYQIHRVPNIAEYPHPYSLQEPRHVVRTVIPGDQLVISMALIPFDPDAANITLAVDEYVRVAWMVGTSANAW